MPNEIQRTASRIGYLNENPAILTLRVDKQTRHELVAFAGEIVTVRNDRTQATSPAMLAKAEEQDVGVGVNPSSTLAAALGLQAGDVVTITRLMRLATGSTLHLVRAVPVLTAPFPQPGTPGVEAPDNEDAEEPDHEAETGSN